MLLKIIFYNISMEGQIVDVEYEDEFVEICKIVARHDTNYVVKMLVYDADAFIYHFSHYTHTIPIESVSGFYDTVELEDTCDYEKIGYNRYRYIYESDPEYEFEDGYTSSDTDSEVSLYDEREHEYDI